MQKRHHPFHLYLDEAVYFVSARVYKGEMVLNTAEKRQLVLEAIQTNIARFKGNLYAWTILPNHYHVLFKLPEGKELPKLMQTINGRCAFEINALDQRRGRKVFQNYWDYCIRDQKDFYTHFNYIHHNAVKHGHAKKMGDYSFSSYRYWCARKGENWLISCFREYPVVGFSEHEE